MNSRTEVNAFNVRELSLHWKLSIEFDVFGEHRLTFSISVTFRSRCQGMNSCHECMRVVPRRAREHTARARESETQHIQSSARFDGFIRAMPRRASSRVRAIAAHVIANDRHHPRDVVRVSHEVAEALKRNQPVVALESTLVAHGMPYPANALCAKACVRTIEALGACAATIGIVDGALVVGMSDDEIEFMAANGSAIAKASRRDIAACVAKRMTAATTVSATMFIARRAGIDVFVTGGIGGVHRNGEVTMDVSADLTELMRTPVAVVCAGCKSILDIARTLEVLETNGVAVIGYETDEFPAFFTRASGVKCPTRCDGAEECARVVKATGDANLQSGIVFAVPIPKEHEGVGEEIERATREALKEAEARGVMGRDVTPYVLRRVAEITRGASLEANVALVQNNAAVGARIAVALAALKKAEREREEA